MNDNKINTYLKFIISILTILIIVSLVVLITLLIKKKLSTNKSVKNFSFNTGYKTIKLKELNLPNNCQPFEIIYKENYIAIYSKQCGIIKVIPIN